MLRKIVYLILILIIIAGAGFILWQQLGKKPLNTEEIKPLISEEQALQIAMDSEDCSMAGVLTDNIIYNAVTKRWWIDLERMPELDEDGCNPACVVSEETKTAEVNWRCTGVILPGVEPISIECSPEQRNIDACIEIYQPVCGTVQVQCITEPCDPVKETFSNSCFACQNPLVTSYTEGECQ